MSSPSTEPAAANVEQKPSLGRILASRKLTAILVLGCASGLPFNLTDSTMQAWLKSYGLSNTKIGLFTLVALPYAWKFLWAPLLDRYSLPLGGRRRGWVLLAQMLLAAVIFLLAAQDPSGGLGLVAVLAFSIAFLSASQDIVIDAYRTDVAQRAERGLAAAATNIGYRTAAWFSFAMALVIADFFSWRASFLTMAALMLVFAVVTWFAPEPQYTAEPPRSLVESVREPLRELLASRTTVALILALLLYKVGDAFALKLFTPFLMDVGFSLTEIGLVSKFVMTGGAVLGALLGGLAMVRWTLAQSLVVFGVCQAVSNLAYWAVAIIGKNYTAMVGAVFVDSLASGMGNVAIVAWIMALCNKRFSAFQYALLSAIAVIPRTYLGPPAGYIADNYGWASFYVLSFAIALPGLFLVWFWRDKVASLDTSK